MCAVHRCGSDLSAKFHFVLLDSYLALGVIDYKGDWDDLMWLIAISLKFDLNLGCAFVDEKRHCLQMLLDQAQIEVDFLWDLRDLDLSAIHQRL